MNDTVDANESFEKGKSYFEAGNQIEAMRYFLQATLLAPEKPEYHAWLSCVFNSQENYSSALESANKAIQLDPNCSLAYRQRAYVYYTYEQNYPNAIKDYSRAITLNPEDALSYYWRACVYYQIDDYAQAIQDYSQTIERDPMNADAYYWRGQSYKLANDIPEAIDDFSQAIRLNPKAIYAYLMRGGCYYTQGDFLAAIQDYSKAIEIDPKNSDGYRFRADAYVLQNNHQAAIQDYTHAILLNPNEGSLYGLRGVIYYTQEDYIKGLQDFSRAIQLDPQNDMVYEYRGEVFLTQKDYPKAIQDYSSAIELNSTNPYTFLRRGLAYAIQADYEKALADLTQAIDLDPQNESAYEFRGDIYVEKGDYSKAIQDYSDALKINPDNLAIQNSLNLAQRILNGEMEPAIRLSDEAIDFFDQAITLIQNADQSSYNRACRDAISLLSLAINKAGSSFPRAHAIRAMLYLDVEEYESAWNEADQALKLDPNEFRAQNVKTRIAGGSVQVADTGIVKSIFKIFTAKSARESYDTSYNMSAARASQNRFKKEVIKLLVIFQNLCAKSLDASEYLYFAEQLIDLADLIIQNRIPLDKNVNIYSCVAATTVSNLIYEVEEQKEEVNRIKMLAQGRVTSFR